METYILICKIDSQGEFAVWLRKFKQGFCINLEEWDGAGDRKEVQIELHICCQLIFYKDANSKDNGLFNKLF